MPAYLVTVCSRHDPAEPDHLFLLDGDLDGVAVARMTTDLLHDPVVQEASWTLIDNLDDEPVAGVAGVFLVEIAYRPGVTDNEAESVRSGAARLGIGGLNMVKTLRRYRVAQPGDERDLYNDLIQTALRYPAGSGAVERRAWYAHLLHPPADHEPFVARVPITTVLDDDLMRISQEGILSLDLDEMRAIQAYYRSEGREPTDGELETLAQTWSEHCSHKTFKGRIIYKNLVPPDTDDTALPAEVYPSLHRLMRDDEIDSLIRTFLMAATWRVLEQRKSLDFAVISAFVDNAGIVAFDDDYEVSFKVETHNHPSALEPFGGANTGVGGVVRDVLGVSAQPIANTDVLCFGPLDLPPADLSPGVLHPRRVAAGVVAGVRDYGNKLGIPTVNGAVLYDRGYVANPLVYCGAVGLAPRDAHPRAVRPGDAIVVIGGRTGRDGIHGATFSSAELTHTTAEEVGSAVQIGDPITEKKMMDVILQARDRKLYSAITDCGAGGLSSAVGEMGAECGAEVDLARAPLKYAGLQPWEIWLSEAQERMVLAVPQSRLTDLLTLCAGEDVEATVIGRYTDTGRLVVRYNDMLVVDLAMSFLHNGRPQRVLEAHWYGVAPSEQRRTNDGHCVETDASNLLLALLAHPNIASKEPIVRTYDYEVGGRTVVKPLIGDGPGDAAVLQPLPSSMRGIVIGCGINPRYGRIDPYWMALACVDEALRNVVAVGADPARAALLDNFCWGDPRLPDRMAGLVRAAAGCYDAAVAYGAPFISGKDSLNNEYRDAEGRRTPIPPTLLISALALIPDIRRAVTSDLKEVDNSVYLVGITKAELGGAHLFDVLPQSSIAATVSRAQTRVPRVDLVQAPHLMAALHRAIDAGLVRACHDLSEGGLGVAAAEMALAGNLGLALDLRTVPRDPDVDDDLTLLFSESPSRFLVEVRPADSAAFEAMLAGYAHARIGMVTEADVQITGLTGATVVHLPLSAITAAWQGATVV
ncbi:phosphoribosylformylglycinamidine synthase subunit PurL [Roseiflexus castenholzii]|uniref:phosphoribosylformylglycinamidine synthase subunit PurL n=1 Tax=Roseiflexus castenholzii TaxID=120962 RepID=UPI003C7A8D34